MNCPRCDAALTAEEIRRLNAQLNSSLRKTKTGGRKGGRPKGSKNAVQPKKKKR
jgi:transcription initiation factor IIE alpha subunit